MRVPIVSDSICYFSTPHSPALATGAPAPFGDHARHMRTAGHLHYLLCPEHLLPDTLTVGGPGGCSAAGKERYGGEGGQRETGAARLQMGGERLKRYGDASAHGQV